MSSIITGRVWKFGDNINTDLMLPNIVNGGASTLDEQGRAVFSANRPGWVDEMRPGDFIVGGQSYGIGSNRPAARSLRHIGIACLLAETINGLFFRNCVNFGLLALECPGVSDAFEERHTAEVSLADFTVRNREYWRDVKGYGRAGQPAQPDAERRHLPDAGEARADRPGGSARLTTRDGYPRANDNRLDLPIAAGGLAPRNAAEHRIAGLAGIAGIVVEEQADHIA